jgi:hypothetical protein
MVHQCNNDAVAPAATQQFHATNMMNVDNSLVSLLSFGAHLEMFHSNQEYETDIILPPSKGRFSRERLLSILQEAIDITSDALTNEEVTTSRTHPQRRYKSSEPLNKDFSSSSSPPQ